MNGTTNLAAGARIQITGRTQHARIHVMPSKIFSRDGATITSVLKLTAEEADAGGFFEVETLHGKETIFIDEDAKSGDTKTLQGKGLPLPQTQQQQQQRQRKAGGAAAGSSEEDVPKGDHVVKLEVARRKTPEPESEPVPEEEEEEEQQQDVADEVDAPPAKKAKTVEEEEGAPAAAAAAQTTTAVDLEALLAAKKKALLAALEAKTSS